MARRIKEVTQKTSKTTSVEFSGYQAIISTVALTDAAAGEFEFTINNDKSVLWIANGFVFFADKGGQPLLVGFNWLDRYRIWNEYRAEVRRRALL